MKELNNIGTCLILYTCPEISFEGDEDDFTAQQIVQEAYSQSKYIGFTFPETPELLPVIEGFTNIYFTVKVAGLVPFNNENDFKAIADKVSSHEFNIEHIELKDDSVYAKKIDIAVIGTI